MERDGDEKDSLESGAGVSSKGSVSVKALEAAKPQTEPAEQKKGCASRVAYQDYASLGIGQAIPKSPARQVLLFHEKLHAILSNKNFQAIITWLPHGRAWKILDRKRLEGEVFPLYFERRCFSTFKRQICGWGFHRISSGVDTGSYFHELFLRGLPHLCLKMKRLTAKDMADRKMRRAAGVEPAMPPDFYAEGRYIPLPLHPGGAMEMGMSSASINTTTLRSSFAPTFVLQKPDASSSFTPSTFLATVSARDTALENILRPEISALGSFTSSLPAGPSALGSQYRNTLVSGDNLMSSVLSHERNQMHLPPPHMAHPLSARHIEMQQQYRDHQLQQLVHQRLHGVQIDRFQEPSRAQLISRLYTQAAARNSELRERIRRATAEKDLALLSELYRQQSRYK